MMNKTKRFNLLKTTSSIRFRLFAAKMNRLNEHLNSYPKLFNRDRQFFSSFIQKASAFFFNN